MATTLQKRYAEVAGTLVLAVALLVLTAGVAQARPSLPQLIHHHSSLVATASSGGGTAGATTGAAPPLVAGRYATGGRAAPFARGLFVPATTTTSGTGLYIGLGALLLALAALATGLIVSERRGRNAAPASAPGATVSSMPSAKPAASAGREGSEEARRKAA